MRSSWNFSTAIFEIWVLVLTKPGWANETPTTSLRVPREYNYGHHVHHQHHHHHYTVAGSTSRGYSDSNHNHHHHQQQHHHHPQQQQHHLHSPSSYYSNSNHHNHNHHLESASSLYPSQHRCYVCLPPNKNSREAQQILDIFAKEVRPLIPDCSAFDPYVDTGRFEFDCPPRYGGCILRIHGSNISRACSKYRVNDCKKANSVEFCYCTTPLCNDKKPEPPIIPSVVHVSRNAGGGGRRPAHSQRGREEEESISSQGIRTRVSDDEDIPSEDDGSGTGSPDHLQTLIDPFTSTADPKLFHEDTVPVEDPNPHTKIGISMTASTSSTSSSSSSGSAPSLRARWALSHNFPLFHLRLFAEQVVNNYHNYQLLHHHPNHHHHHQYQDGLYLYKSQAEGHSSDEGKPPPLSSVFFSQLCFTVSLLLLRVLFS